MTHSDFLPATNPPYPDVKSCDAWLAKAALGDTRSACAAFHALLDEIEEAPPPHGAYLQILERLRPPLLAALAEHTRKFSGKPLPLNPAEAAALKQVHDLWLALLHTYRRLLRALPPGTPDSATTSLLATRSLHCAAEMITAQLLARHPVGDDLWRRLHSLYAFAEARACTDTPVGDPALRETCTTAYVQALLYALAQPCGLIQRDVQWTRSWINRFAWKVSLTRTPEKPHAYAIDLSGHTGAIWCEVTIPAPNPPLSEGPIRFMDTTALGRSLRRRLRRLEEGEDPASIGLGRGCTQPGTGERLRALIRDWCEAPPLPQFPRRPVLGASARLDVAVGFSQAHVVIAGKPFVSGARDWDYTRRDIDHIHMFQRPPETHRTPSPEIDSLEHWEALDESAHGFRLNRLDPGARISHRQLLALRPGGARKFILAEVRWLLQNGEVEITLGTRALPGLARACAVRPTSTDPATQAPYSQAFVLPVAMGLPPSLVVPAGWYQQNRVLDLRLEEGVVRIRLFGLLGRGYDYDRVNFAAIT
jgi:hypothetical protein